MRSEHGLLDLLVLVFPSVVHTVRQLRSWARSLCPCCATTGIWSDSAEKAVLVSQLQFIEGRCFLRAAEANPTVLLVQKTTETLQLQSFRWSMPLLCRSCACPLLCTTEVQTVQTVVRAPVEGLVNVGSQVPVDCPLHQ